MGSLRRIWLCIALSIAIVPGYRANLYAQEAAGAAPIRVTYLGNEGFLIECAGRKILVDALYQFGVAGYAVISYETRQRMEAAEPPFDGVDVVFASHFHDDHFDATAVARHLKANPEAICVSTPQARDKLAALNDFPTLEDRVYGVLPKEGERATVEHAGVLIELLNLHHGRTRPVQNLGMIIHVGGRTLLHVGDTEATTEDFERCGLQKEKFDIAFIPYWYLSYVRYKSHLRNGITASHIVPMHIPPKDLHPSFMDDLGGWQFGTQQMVREFPNAFIFADELETHVFE